MAKKIVLLGNEKFDGRWFYGKIAEYVDFNLRTGVITVTDVRKIDACEYSELEWQSANDSNIIDGRYYAEKFGLKVI